MDAPFDHGFTPPPEPDGPSIVPSRVCERCGKAAVLCVCDVIAALPTRVHVLVLQHPQEPDVVLGSAKLTHLSLPSSTLRVGLSWANLKAALGDAATAKGRDVSPSRWAVLYLGSGAKGGVPAGQLGGKRGEPRLVFLDKKGAPAAEQRPAIDGVVVLDGTWSQAKTLWWRNAWLLKLRRAMLVPSQPSLYGRLRKEPRGECLSTIESVADALVALGEPPEVGAGLRRVFATLLDRERQRQRTGGIL